MPFFSLLMPTFGHQDVISETLMSIKKQDFNDFEVIIIPNGCSELYRQVAKEWQSDPRFNFIFDLPNVGYCRNLSRCLDFARGEFIIYFASDDIMSANFLDTYANVFKSPSKVEAVLRTYYAFDDDINIAVRSKRRLSEDVAILNIAESAPSDIHVAMETMDQLSGLAFKAHPHQQLENCDVFPCHAYPVMDVILRTKIFAYISTDLMAVRIGESQSRSISAIYNTSPIQSWEKFVNFYFTKFEYKNLNHYLLKNWIGVNYVGLFQIRNFSERPYVYLFREVFYLIKINPLAIFNPVFLSCFFLCVFVPSFMLLKLTDFVKNKLLKIIDSNVGNRSIEYIN